MLSSATIRPIHPGDKTAINQLLDYKDRIHRHLDWRSPNDLWDETPFLVLEYDFTIQAALACPVDPVDVSWVRFFGAMPGMPVEETWHLMLQQAMAAFEKKPQTLVSVALQAWYLHLLYESGFKLNQMIVVLYLNTPAIVPAAGNDALIITPMKEEEMDEVVRIDNLAFQSIWRNSYKDLYSAYQNATYATVARLDGEMVGYQISSGSALNAHLARLAVLPELQGRQIGTTLTYDMIRFFNHKGVSYITVNTQNDNKASLRLYQKLGFRLTGEKFPVMTYEGNGLR